MRATPPAYTSGMNGTLERLASVLVAPEPIDAKAMSGQPTRALRTWVAEEFERLGRQIEVHVAEQGHFYRKRVDVRLGMTL